MIIRTICSESHEPLLERFVSSLDAVEKPGTRLDVHRMEQFGDGTYGTDAFKRAMKFKLRCLRDWCAVDSEPFVFADCDILWLRPFMADLRGLLDASPHDLLCQQHGVLGRHWACTGLMVVRPSAELSRMWDQVLDLLPDCCEEETATRKWMRANGKGWTLLPPRYWTPGIEGRHWEPGYNLNLPEDAVCLHASWTVGIANKLAMMDEALRLLSPNSFGVDGAKPTP